MNYMFSISSTLRLKNNHIHMCESFVLVRRCPSITAPAHGVMLSSNVEAGSHVNFQCTAGYRLVGSQRITCRLDGTWSGQPPTCQGMCKCLLRNSIINTPLYLWDNKHILNHSLCLFMSKILYLMTSQWRKVNHLQYTFRVDLIFKTNFLNSFDEICAVGVNDIVVEPVANAQTLDFIAEITVLKHCPS